MDSERSSAPSWQANLARIRQELAPGFQAVLDLAIRKIEAQLSDSAPKLGTNVPEMGTAAPSGCLSVAPEVLDKARLEMKSQLCGCCDEYSNDHAKDMANELLRLHALLSANTKTPKSHDELLRKKPVLIDQHGNDIYPPKLCNWIEDACRLLRGAPLLDEREGK